MTPLRKQVVGKMYPSSYHIWKDPTPPHVSFVVKKCEVCGLGLRRSWGAKLCKCINPSKEI